MIKRTILPLLSRYLHKKRAIIIYGARRTGKTTLMNALAESLENIHYINCDLIDGQEMFNFRNIDEIKLSFGRYSYLLIDEAQRVRDIGIKLKSIIDNLPDLQLIVTGSSSLELSNSMIEPLTGRKFEFILTPLSIGELYEYGGINAVSSGMQQRLIYGSYPEVFLEKEMPEEIIREIAGSYLFRDMLIYQDIKRSDLLQKLLISLALQIGNEVSTTELANIVGLDRKTVEKYLWLLEQSYIIYRLGSFKRNLRNELKRANKYYFWDTGIRNSLINNFNRLEIRDDAGALWENYLITERRKMMLNKRATFEHYFWRTTTQQEIDLIEVENDEIRAFEIKWSTRKKVKIPLAFTKGYEQAKTYILNRENYLDSFL
ncbi:MAG: ATP-binding protein [Candidatus Cloacimonetes bacterium]|nr:ATP-binding protein [Candidatus Cloacimonadota bacterium]